MTTSIQTGKLIANYVGGEWVESQTADCVEVTNPATSEVLANVALAGSEDVARAVGSAAAAFPAWRRTPPQERIQYLFRFQRLLELHLGEIARITTTIAEEKVSCASPTRMAVETARQRCPAQPKALSLTTSRPAFGSATVWTRVCKWGR
jgi:malonate-semialdehyde dehydrogenase (acetylating) / methylmalonate-semialdehyde dehydrogenase